MKVIGFLNSGAPETLGEQVAAFHRGLEQAGYVDGQNVTIQYRWGYDDYKRGNHKRLEALAAELAKLPVAVLVAAGGRRHQDHLQNTRPPEGRCTARHRRPIFQ